jgi:hypothetical protein
MSPKEAGCTGRCLFVKHLSYVDHNNLFLVPVAHTFLFGIVKKFWGLLLPKAPTKVDKDQQWRVLKSKERELMHERAANITATLEFGRTYRDITKHKGNYTMEDWKNWTEVRQAVCKPTMHS